MAETGFCTDGEQETLIRDRRDDIGGAMPVNTDGGCLANGEPIGASGLRQVYECRPELRGGAGAAPGAGRTEGCLYPRYGAPGVSACTVLSV